MIRRVTFCGSMMLISTVSRSSWGTDSPSLMIGHITSNMKFTILLEWFSLKESLKCHKCHRMVSLINIPTCSSIQTMKTSTKDGWKEFSIQQIVFNCSFRCFLSFPNIFRIGTWKAQTEALWVLIKCLLRRLDRRNLAGHKVTCPTRTGCGGHIHVGPQQGPGTVSIPSKGPGGNAPWSSWVFRNFRGLSTHLITPFSMKYCHF